jgi:purine-binding chemotaxis protein CheW
MAIPFESVQRIAPMAQLARPPGMPSMLEGILNLTGSALPVLRLDRLFHLPLQPLGLHSALIIVSGVSDGRIAILVDRVSEILTVPENGLLPVSDDNSFNGCAEALAPLRGQMIHVLSLKRLLLKKEREALSGFQAMAQRRLLDWESEAL